MRRVLSAARWRFADLLNLSRRLCWADLVMWGLRRQTLRQTVASGVGVCHSDAARTGVCWCSKFRTESVQREAEQGCGIQPAPHRFVIRGDAR